MLLHFILSHELCEKIMVGKVGEGTNKNILFKKKASKQKIKQKEQRKKNMHILYVCTYNGRT